jgi:hypothetical protein
VRRRWVGSNWNSGRPGAGGGGGGGGGVRVDLPGSGYRPVAGSCGLGDEISGSGAAEFFR